MLFDDVISYFCLQLTRSDILMNCKTKELNDTMVIDFLVEDRYRLLRHVVSAICFFIFLYFADFWHWYKEGYRYFVLLFVFVSLIGMAYINIYVLVPLFFFKTRYVIYFLLLFTLGIVGLNLIGNCFEIFFAEYKIEGLENDARRGGLYEGIMICIPIILVSTTVKLIQKWTKDNKRIVELSNLTLKMELNELRNQINPHFLFNMMNNVKALIRTDPEKATVVIMKLSEFLRYQLYENNEEKTLLTSEIDFLSNFLNLEKIRREDFQIYIDSKTDKRTLNSTFIPPNLFTTFVENAVKHSVDISGKESYVKVNIEIKDKTLHFECRNSQNSEFPIPETIYGGLGLVNIKRRLELLYKNTFTLEINSTKNEYIVNLIIPV
ncbi:Sensor histidine kinase YehU [Chryseobacterium sp. MOF25P]|nr:Sensor histidine kinase YehU [Chryseobacterium sp. MOF25P]OBW46902.1 Sensor histidine kinase YehU [Chryseobacterium sp. BGARF1]